MGERARTAASEAKGAAGRATDSAQDAAAKAERHRIADWVEGIGQAANGIVHLIIGGIALGVAFGSGGSADQSGAMRALRESPAGALALWAVGIALVALAVHAVVRAVADSRRDRWAAARSAGRAVAYLVVGVTALGAASGGSSDSEQGTESFSADLMAAPLGLWLVAAIGVVVAIVGVAFVVRGARLRFREEIAPPARLRPLVEALGGAGYVAKGLAVVIVGALFVIAAVQHDPQEAGGLDGALHSLTTVPGGVFALVGIALGLMLYGAYCFARGAWSR